MGSAISGFVDPFTLTDDELRLLFPALAEVIADVLAAGIADVLADTQSCESETADTELPAVPEAV